MSDLTDAFTVVGRKCNILDDPEKAVLVNNGDLLVPWFGVKSFLIDRYDCRVYLPELKEYESSDSLDCSSYLSEEEASIEKLCEFERYLELQTDIDDLLTEIAEEKKRGQEDSRQYGAVNFSYDEVVTETTEAVLESNSGETEEKCEVAEDPYICPPELKSLEGLRLPTTDKQAQIIERTAVFVARQGNQMEIILKAKQHKNPFFGFLNYDDELNEFYKGMVHLIRQGRYIPKPRPTPSEQPIMTPSTENKSINDDTYELKLPKVDISNTAYASLINKFKKANDSLPRATMEKNTDTKASPELDNTKDLSSKNDVKNVSSGVEPTCSDMPCAQNQTSTESATTASSNPDTVNPAISSEDSEHYYQEYYKHYYPYYYAQVSEQHAQVLGHANFTEEQRDTIVQESAKAAAIAASAAVNALLQSKPEEKTSSIPETPDMTPGERAVIDKMAEYVTRNGIEFEELVSQQKAGDARFGFLKPDHPFHSYYVSKRKEWELKSGNPELNDATTSVAKEENTSDQNSANANNECAKPLDNPNERQPSISFKLTRPNSSTKLHLINGTDSTVTSSTVPNVYVHPSSYVDSKAYSSCPVLVEQYDSPVRANTPESSPEPVVHNSHQTPPNRNESPPVRFHLPGIPNSSSDSSRSSSRNTTPEPSPPVHSRRRSMFRPSRSSVESSTAKSSHDPLFCPRSPETSVPSHTQKTTRHSRSPLYASPAKSSPNPLLYPRSDIPCLSPVRSASPESVKACSPSTSLNSLLLEDILDMDDRRLGFSPPHVAKPRQLATFDSQRSVQERRRRAAQAFAQLQAIISTETEKPQAQDTSGAALTVAPKKSTPVLPPPPAPDSVPAAVAHAVVASLKRRHEESLATLEAETKARRRMRSPPAAYALPKKSRKSKHSKRSTRSPSPVSFDGSHRSKKHKKSRRSSS